MTTPDIAGLCERLRAVESSGHGSVTTNWHRNPDGPPAADTLERQAAQIERLRGALEPFVKLADAFDGDAVEYPAPDSASLGFDYARNKTMFTVADLRKARAALTGEDT
jgi:hypothetical protein